MGLPKSGSRREETVKEETDEEFPVLQSYWEVEVGEDWKRADLQEGTVMES